MEIIKGAITQHASEGRCTLQVPQSWIGDGIEFEHVPDDWFMYLKDGRVAIGKESGFLYLSYKGYIANKAVLLKAFANSGIDRGHNCDPKAFESHAEKFFSDLERKTRKQISSLQKKLVEFQQGLQLVTDQRSIPEQQLKQQADHDVQTIKLEQKAW